MKVSDFAAEFPGELVPIPEADVAFVSAPLPPQIAISPELTELNDDAVSALGGLKEIIGTLPNPTLITNPFLRREAVLSSRIEGTHTNLEQLYLFEAGSSREEKSSSRSPQQDDALEVFNYVRALHRGLELLAVMPVCNRLLRAMHEQLLEGVPDSRQMLPGRFRQGQAYIGDPRRGIKAARYVAAPAERIEVLMHDLEKYINSRDNLPTLIRIALIHYQFESIHPFADGNGRIGRLLILVLMIAYKRLQDPLLYLSGYFERNRDSYVQHLWEVSRSGAWDEWIKFFLVGVRDEALDASSRTHQLLNLRQQYRDDMQSTRGGLLKLLESLFVFPVITTPGTMKLLELSTNKGARKIIEKLESKGIVTEVPGKKRNKLFVAKPIMDILGSDIDTPPT